MTRASASACAFRLSLSDDVGDGGAIKADEEDWSL